MSEEIPTTVPTSFLTKEEELDLGRRTQAMFKSQELLEEDDQLPPEQRMTEQARRKHEAIIEDGKLAVDTLVRANMGLVYDRVRIFKSKYPYGLEFEDLVQEGTIGLITAASKYDPERGNKFSTLAYHWIRQAVTRGSNRTGRLVRLPENRINDLIHMNRVINDAEGEGITSEEMDRRIEDKLNLSKKGKKDMFSILAAAQTPASLNKQVSMDGSSSKELIDFIADKHAHGSAEEGVLQQETQNTLYRAIDELDEVQRAVVLAQFGLPLGGKQECTPSQVREQYSLAPTRYKKIQMDAMNTLRQKLTEQGFSLGDFLQQE